MEITQDMRQKAINYKKNVAGKFMLVEGAKMKTRVSGEDFCVTRKIDGHMQCLFFDNGEYVMLNSSGNMIAEKLKCLDTFAGFMGKAGVKTAVIVAELYLPRENGRPRCGDIRAALADNELKDQLALAAFDIIEIDGQAFERTHYKEVYEKLKDLLSLKVVKTENGRSLTLVKTSSMCKVVEMRTATSVGEVEQIYTEWVEGEGAEGLVVHSELPVVFKVKPRHSIDAAVIGYTTSDNGIRSLMMAVRHEDGNYQMFAVGSNALSDEQCAELAERLSEKHVDSQYVLSDSRGIAYQMVKPELVFEVTVIELVAKGNDDKVKTNPLLSYDEEKGWLIQGIVPGVSAQSLSFVQERTDKTPTPSDIRVSQLTDLCPFEEMESDKQHYAESTLLERKVFKKVTGEKVMLHKFLIWKTNKEESGRYPAYVFYHTDYSNSRKDIIKRDMAYSNDEQQIRDIFAAVIADNVKKGWVEVL